jgi:hypothetical protein
MNETDVLNFDDGAILVTEVNTTGENAVKPVLGKS